MKQRGGLFAVFAALTAGAFHVGSVSSSARAPGEGKGAAGSALMEYRPSEDALRHVLKDFTKSENDIPSPLDKPGNSLSGKKER